MKKLKIQLEFLIIKPKILLQMK
ncbi:hypothetical protein Godav_011843 [Gossypium davidsonii]|uniref:Uncharacterized protein n=1 Tax=Gossypium davidsonii TaxID=34287 RepID=A0A7J8RBB8_GOSDV|nr:hypothetical protein [Gossypium davidsonii]